MSDRLTRRDALRGIGMGASGLVLSTSANTVSADPDHCPRPVGYWKRNTDEWVDGDGEPLERMSVAHDMYPSRPEFADDDEVTVLDILTAPSYGDLSIIMASERIAAQLNYWTSISCEESDLAYARATAWLWALDEPLVDDDGDIGTDQREWDVEVPETDIETPSVDVTVEAGTYGQSVWERLREHNRNGICTCTVEE